MGITIKERGATSEAIGASSTHRTVTLVPPHCPRRMRRSKHQDSPEARTLEVAAAEVPAHLESVAPGASVAQAPAPLPPQIALSNSGR